MGKAWLLGLALAALAAGGWGLAQSADTSPGACSAPAGWFAGGVPDPDIHAHDDKGFASLCDFHTWSWNAFLWLMEDVNGVPRFETFPTLADVENGTFDPGTPPPGEPRLKLRVEKTDHPINDIAQAATPGILVDQNGRAVYYSQYVNPQMYKQIRDLNWFTFEGLQAESPLATFDVGNIELKAAWKVLGPGEEAPYAYVRKASIPHVVNTTVDGVTRIGVPSDPAQQTFEEVDVALIGFHVVGWVAGHAEAIWATFSPPGIAPVVPDGQTSGPVSATGTPFYAADAPLGDCNQTAVPIQKLDEASQIFSVRTDACQIYANGTLPAMQGKPNPNRDTIEQLNASVASQLAPGSLAGRYHEIGAVWSVSDFAAFCQALPEASRPPECAAPDQPTVIDKPEQIRGKLSSTFQSALLGSTVVSNPVVETFTQTQIGEDNCLGCHNSIQYQPSDPAIPALKASMLNVSHIILEAYVGTAPRQQ